MHTVHDNLMMSLHFLKTNYVDAYLLHFPSGDWISTYKEIEKEYISGYAKAIGVCNFDVQELQQLMKEVKIKPMICQVELNPLNTKKGISRLLQGKWHCFDGTHANGSYGSTGGEVGYNSETGE